MWPVLDLNYMHSFTLLPISFSEPWAQTDGSLQGASLDILGDAHILLDDVTGESMDPIQGREVTIIWKAPTGLEPNIRKGPQQDIGCGYPRGWGSRACWVFFQVSELNPTSLLRYLQANWKPGKCQALGDMLSGFDTVYQIPLSSVDKQLTMYCSINSGPGRLAQICSSSLWSLVSQPSFSHGFTGWLSYWGTSSKCLLFQTARFFVCLWSVTFTVSSAWACWIEHFKQDACSRMVDMTSSTSFSASYPEVHGTRGRREWCSNPPLSPFRPLFPTQEIGTFWRNLLYYIQMQALPAD